MNELAVSNPTVETLGGASDLSELDRFAARVPLASPFQTGFMARIYAKSPDTVPIVLAVRDSQGSVVASMVAVVFSHGTRPRGIVNRWSQHCTVRGTPLVASEVQSKTAIQSLTSSLVGFVPPDTLYVRHYPDRNSSFATLLRMEGYAHEEWLNFVVDLSLEEEELFKRMSKHRRKGIRAASRLGLVASEVRSPNELVVLYRLIANAHSRLKIPFQRLELFNAVLEDLAPKGQALLLTARRDGEAVASRVVLIFGKVAYDWYSGSDPTKQELHADEFLTWTGMLEAKEHGATMFDFGGAGPPDMDYGPREFKRRFGGVETNHGRYTRVLRPVRLKAANIAMGLLRRLP